MKKKGKHAKEYGWNGSQTPLRKERVREKKPLFYGVRPNVERATYPGITKERLSSLSLSLSLSLYLSLSPSIMYDSNKIFHSPYGKCPQNYKDSNVWIRTSKRVPLETRYACDKQIPFHLYDKMMGYLGRFKDGPIQRWFPLILALKDDKWKHLRGKLLYKRGKKHLQRKDRIS